MKNILNEIKKDTSLKLFASFLIFSAVMWVLIPASYYESLHYDPAETLMWGSTFNLGNAKHPPMAGYMLYCFCSLFKFQSFSIFLLSQIVVTAGLIYIYKLARCFFDRPRSVMAALLITFYFLYNYETPKFNANVPHILFIPMMCYYFYKGTTENKLWQWLLLSISCACAVLTKYYAGVVLLAFLIYVFSDKDARKTLRTVNPYLAGIFFFLLMSPHLFHLWKTGFLSLSYVSSGKEKQYGYFVQIGAMLGSMLIPFLCMTAAAYVTSGIDRKKWGWRFPVLKNPAAAKYAGCIIGTQAALIMILAFANQRLETMWTYQMFFLAGILIMAFYPDHADQKTIRIFAILVFLFAFTVMAVDLVYSNTSSSFRRHIEKERFKLAAQNYYERETGSREIPFITGEVWHCAILQNVFGYRIKAAPDHDRILLGLHQEKLREKGALIITSERVESERYIREYFGQTPKWKLVEIPYKARFGREKIHRFYFGIVNPAGEKPQKCPGFISIP